MSRQRRQYWLEAEQRWPELQQLLACYLHQDWPDDYGNPDKAVDMAMLKSDTEQKMQACREYGVWNSTAGWKADVRRSIEDGLGVDVFFENDLEARQFMNSVFDKLIVSIRGEFGAEWKP